MKEEHMANSDIAALARHWSELEAAGIPLEPLEDRVGLDTRKRGAGLTIRAGRDRQRSEIRELKDGRFAYILPIFIRRDHPGKTIILDCWISPPWLDTNVALVDDPIEGKHPGYYNLPHETERFVRESVLNHRMNCTLSRGDIRDGFLLAVGLRPPEAYAKNQLIEVTVGVLDQWDVEHCANVQARMNRLPARQKEIYKSTRGPLFSRRDVIPPKRSLIAPPNPPKQSPEEEHQAIRHICEEMARIHAKHKHAKAPVG
jgi:hypothetical protein